jgi:DnaJ-class molecular chaperone
MKRLVRKEIRPIFSSTVDPSEYDIKGQMERMVQLANKNHECFCEMDVGKLWGLYLAWDRLANTQNSGGTPSAPVACSACLGCGYLVGPSRAYPITEAQEELETVECHKCHGTGKQHDQAQLQTK